LIKGKDVLSLVELTEQEIRRVLEVAKILKLERSRNILRPLLRNRSLAMIFQKPSTRTRVSFEVAMHELGGHALNLSSSELQLARGETIEDTARVLSGYVNVIMARVYHHNDLIELADAAKVPVINGLSDLYHPCQILADLLTIHEAKGRLEGLKIAWIGDGNNVCNTMLVACGKLGIDVSVAVPRGYAPSKAALEAAQEDSRKSGSKIEIVHDPKRAVVRADVVATDTFVSMGMEKEREKRLKDFLPEYQVAPTVMKLAKKDAIFMHCLPAHRGEEVASKVIDGAQSVVWQEAENRLHAQKALLALLLLGEEGLPWN